MCSCGCFVFTHSSLMATSSPEAILAPARGGGGHRGPGSRSARQLASGRGQVGRLCLSSSAPLGGRQKSGRGPCTASKGSGGTVGKEWTPGPVGAGGEGGKSSMCEGKAGRNCGHITEPQAGAARMSDVKGGEMGCRRLTDHVRGILPWRVGAPELERSEVSGMSGLRRREGSGASFCLKKSQERPECKLCLASVSPALILSRLS